MQAKAEKALIKKAQNCMFENEITLIREDKSKKVVILEKRIYDNYLQKYIEESQAENLGKDPTDSLDRKVLKFPKNEAYQTL